MARIDVQALTARLPELLARVEEGERIAITRNGLAVADLIPRAIPDKRRGRGVWREMVDMSRFDEADEEIAREFGMLD